MLKTIIPKPLQPGDMLRVIAPSSSGKTINAALLRQAEKVWKSAGFQISFGKNVFEINRFRSSSRASRLKDLHQAFADPKVQGIITIRGGFNSNDLLDYIDWSLIKKNPKVFCGYSDITALQNSIFKKTGLLTYSGPNFSNFGRPKKLSYTFKNFLNAVSDNFEAPLKNNTKISVINKGRASGRILGGNLCTFNLLQGTAYLPDIAGSILFFEDDHVSTIDLLEFYRNLQSVINLPNFKKVRGLVFGTFEKASKITPATIKEIVRIKPELNGIPVIAGVTFGHTLPMLTLPIGGRAEIDTSKDLVLKIASS